MSGFLVIVNPASGGGFTEEKRAQLAHIFEAAGCRHEFVPLASPAGLVAAAEQAAARAAASGEVLVAVGGDGTLTTVAQAAHQHRCTMGAIPQGTFNYFGRALGIPQELELGARALLRASVKPVQVGLLNGRVFLVNASLGLYPELLDEREAFLARFGRRRWVALFAALATLAKWRHQLALEVEANGQVRRLRTPTLFVGNNAIQLARLGLEPDLVQRVGLGYMAALVVKPIGTFSMLGLLLRGAFGRMGEADQIESFPFQRLTVRPRGVRRAKVAADGETGVMAPPMHFEVSVQPLMMLIPCAEDRVAAE